MHDCSSAGSIRPFKVRAVRAPWQRCIRHLLFATAGIGLLSIGQVAAQDTADPASSAAEQTSPSATPGKNGKICEYELVTGSRMKKRVCYTPERWEARQRAGKELTRELDSKSIGADANGG